MAESYIISIDQSTQGTKALLFDQDGMLLQRKDLPHKQIINEKGWVSHDPEEIYQNTVQVVKNLVEASGISKESVKGIGISNQRETSLVWEKETGKAIAHAVVWQCARAAEICRRVEETGAAEMIRKKTGLALSPYFPASKLAWLKENVEGAEALAKKHALCFGTIDTWLVYRMTHGTSYKTDYSNASRTQLFDIFEQRWDEEICQLFGLDAQDLAEVCDSDSCFGETDLDGFFEKPVPIHSVLGDSHGALFGQGCLEKGMIKSTYGTGSSIMMNIGETPVLSTHGVVTSLAWGMQGKINYVLEGNINYTGAVITWLKDDMELIQSPAETEELCRKAEADDSLYFVPAFTGLGAPYWNSEAKGALIGITRTTRKAEMVCAGVECIAYQIVPAFGLEMRTGTENQKAGRRSLHGKDDMALQERQERQKWSIETEELCRKAEADDSLYFVPAFTGLGAPYWNSEAKGALSGITRTTRKAEMVRAGVECIAYQIADVVNAMSQDAKTEIQELRVDGGPTRNQYLMQFQSDILNRKVLVPDAEELSGIGAAYAAGRGLGLYGDEVFARLKRQEYTPQMCEEARIRKYNGWKDAVKSVLK